MSLLDRIASGGAPALEKVGDQLLRNLQFKEQAKINEQLYRSRELAIRQQAMQVDEFISPEAQAARAKQREAGVAEADVAIETAPTRTREAIATGRLNTAKAEEGLRLLPKTVKVKEGELDLSLFSNDAQLRNIQIGDLAYGLSRVTDQASYDEFLRNFPPELDPKDYGLTTGNFMLDRAAMVKLRDQGINTLEHLRAKDLLRFKASMEASGRTIPFKEQALIEVDQWLADLKAGKPTATPNPLKIQIAMNTAQSDMVRVMADAISNSPAMTNMLMQAYGGDNPEQFISDFRSLLQNTVNSELEGRLRSYVSPRSQLPEPQQKQLQELESAMTQLQEAMIQKQKEFNATDPADEARRNQLIIEMQQIKEQARSVQKVADDLGSLNLYLPEIR